MTSISLRSKVSEALPAPVARLARRMLLWKRRSAFRPYRITKRIDGETFPFWIGDETAEAWYRPEKDPVHQELAFIRDHMLSPGDLVFDVGSHHGLHTICMARHCRRVVAIEPNPHNVAILRKNIALNDLQNVTARQAAVGDSVSKLELLEDSDRGGLCLTQADLPTIEVDVLPLDQLAEEYGFPALLKVDVEGFEDRALKGAAQILRQRPKIMIEVHVEWVARYGSSVSEVIDLLNISSYDVRVMSYPSEEVVSWSGKAFEEYPPPKFTLFLLPKGRG